MGGSQGRESEVVETENDLVVPIYGVYIHIYVHRGGPGRRVPRETGRVEMKRLALLPRDTPDKVLRTSDGLSRILCGLFICSTPSLTPDVPAVPHYLLYTVLPLFPSPPRESETCTGYSAREQQEA